MTIEQLPRYERLPGEYYVVRVADDNMYVIQSVMETIGFSGYVQHSNWWRGDHYNQPRPRLALSAGTYRIPTLHEGDYVTFRRDSSKPYGFDVITYAKDDFEARYRRATPPCT